MGKQGMVSRGIQEYKICSGGLAVISKVIRIQKCCENSFAMSTIKERHQRDKSYRVLNPACRLRHVFV